KPRAKRAVVDLAAPAYGDAVPSLELNATTKEGENETQIHVDPSRPGVDCCGDARERSKPEGLDRLSDSALCSTGAATQSAGRNRESQCARGGRTRHQDQFFQRGQCELPTPLDLQHQGFSGR